MTGSGHAIAVAAVLASMLLSGCVEPAMTPRPKAPLTLPPPDGRAEAVDAEGSHFVVNRMLRQAVSLRVTRVRGADLDYSEGRLAKAAAQAYCAVYNRQLDPGAMGRFSLPNSWIFDGDCL